MRVEYKKSSMMQGLLEVYQEAKLNGKEVRKNDPVRLKSGDKIHFAIYEFRFLLHDKAPFGETVMIRQDEI